MSTGIDKKSGKEMAAQAWPLTPSPPGQQRLIMFRELQKDEGALRTGTLHSPKVVSALSVSTIGSELRGGEVSIPEAPWGACDDTYLWSLWGLVKTCY